jgi:hypothetical protein
LTTFSVPRDQILVKVNRLKANNALTSASRFNESPLEGLKQRVSGYPFSNVQPFIYWSATTHAGATTVVRGVYFGSGFLYDDAKVSVYYCAWCVRGGETYDAW